MALKLFRKLNSVNPSFIRAFSGTHNLISLDVNEKSGIGTLNFQRAPVNSLNLELLEDITAGLVECEKNKCRGLILTSKNDGVFSAGLDIYEMYKPDPERVKKFWSTLQDLWIKLYGTPYPTAAVINGHSPAGGCLLTLCTEYRIMSKNFTIGLNETALGIVAPDWFIDSMKNVIGHRQTELALTTGRLFKTDEAFNIGLVDEVVDSKADGIKSAEAFFARYAKIPPLARSLTKTYVRNKTIQNLINNRDTDLKVFIGFVQSEQVQKSLALYLEALKKKSSAK